MNTAEQNFWKKNVTTEQRIKAVAWLNEQQCYLALKLNPDRKLRDALDDRLANIEAARLFGPTDKVAPTRNAMAVLINLPLEERCECITGLLMSFGAESLSIQAEANVALARVTLLRTKIQKINGGTSSGVNPTSRRLTPARHGNTGPTAAAAALPSLRLERGISRH